jgi:predicted dehydrogenase
MDKTETTPMAGGATRRDFIKRSATAAAAVAATGFIRTPVYGQNTAPSANVKGANEKIVIGHIGVGGQGMAHVRSIKGHSGESNVSQAAVCDLSKWRIGDAQKYIGGNVAGYEDHRKLIERKDIDAVVVATLDHWHASCTVDAMEAGKDVYCEKPMTRYLDEAWKVQDTCKRTGRLVQVGSQGCSAAKYHKAAELIKSGAIGPLVLGQTSYMRNNPKGEWNYDIQKWCTEDDVNWKRWIEPVHKKVPFNPDHYFRWRKYYPYCAGLLGDLIPHLLHPFMLATGNPEFPARVVSLGSKSWHTDKNTPDTYERDVDESVQVIVEFPSGFDLMLSSSTVNEYGMTEMIRGHHATLLMGGLGGIKLELRPERKFADEVDADVFDGLQPAEDISEHEKNWIRCIRTRQQPNCGIDLAVRVQTVISLSEMSDRLNLMCLYDEKTRKITTSDGKEVKPITYGTLELS